MDSSAVQLFAERTTEETGLAFSNMITENNRINILNYLYYYNGAGVAVGDINQDGLPDLYFGATTQPNKLFLNRGELQFEDITERAGVQGDFGITTGVNLVDINHDGLLDIYICKSGVESERYRTNQLFINNGDLTFTENAAAFGLADASFSNQAYFFDMDADNDLDMFLVNHPVDWPNINKIMTGDQNSEGFHYQFSDKLYRNDGLGKFEDITRNAGLLNRSWGLSAAIGDFNDDLLPDIYVANDFIKPDNLYINQGDGTFSEESDAHFRHISFYSMGSDFADINNDGQNDLYVADMAMAGHQRSKRNMESMSTENFERIIERGYHVPYSSNTLQLNVGKKSYADIALSAGVAKTDWSWAPLFCDLDNDGFKDLFVSNGIYRDIIDNDFLLLKTNYDQSTERNYYDDLVQEIPQTIVKNYLFKNNGDLGFSNLSDKWGITEATNSNGAIYSDLDGDGDLDLVMNNLNEPSLLYENLGNDKLAQNYLQIKLTGPDKNTYGIGATVAIYHNEQQQRIDQRPARGYLSSVDPLLHFGLGSTSKVDSLHVVWPDGKQRWYKNVRSNQIVKVDYNDGEFASLGGKESKSILKDVTEGFGLTFRHKEAPYDDFDKELLLPHKLSQNGPFLAVGDVNLDGLEDFYVGGSAGFPGELWLQTHTSFEVSDQVAFDKDRSYEDMRSYFFDADQDGDLDLYVVSGSNEFSSSTKYQDRLYENDGSGKFDPMPNSLPSIKVSGMAVAGDDIDGDGDIDLFVGGRLTPSRYPTPGQSLLLINDAGKFENKISEIAPDLEELGMITDAVFSDIDQDGDNDLVIVGEWLPITFFENQDGKFRKMLQQEVGTEDLSGWWWSIKCSDIDQDGDEDYIVGNIGTNNKYHPAPARPLHLYYTDFDDSGRGDIVLSKENNEVLFPVRGRECSGQQMPFIKEKFPTFKSFAEAPLGQIYDQEKLNESLHYQVEEFRSIVLRNDGNAHFTSIPLPNEAQLSPLMGAIVIDVNRDGHLDIVGGGNFHSTETETIRYDAGSGFCLLSDHEANLTATVIAKQGFLLDGDVRDLKHIVLPNSTDAVLVSNNLGKLQLLKVVGI